MRYSGGLKVLAWAALPLLLIARLHAQGSDTAPLQQQLNARFKLTTMTPNRADIVAAGDIVQVHKSGLLMYSVASPLPASNTYKDGKIGQGAGGFGNDFKIGVLTQASGSANNYPRRSLPPEEKCWVSSVQVQRDGVVFQLISDPYDNIRYYGNLKVPFPIKKTVPPVSVAMAVIAEVLTVVPPANQPAQAAAEPAPDATPAPEPAAPAMPDIAPPPPPTDTPAVSVGQTKTQVVAALGQPDKMEKAGVKDIYYYKSMKITFTGGKVSSVQQ
jgi:hypothetical protein